MDEQHSQQLSGAPTQQQPYSEPIPVLDQGFARFDESPPPLSDRSALPTRKDLQSGVYLIRCASNRKVYVVSSINVGKRIGNHVSDLENNVHHSVHLQRAWQRYGRTAFEFQILERLERADDAQLLTREQYWINFFKSSRREHGFNILSTAGSRLGHKHTAETLRKLRVAKAGKTLSLAHRNSISNAQRGSKSHLAKLTEEVVKEIKLRLAGGEYQAAIARELNLARTTVCDIARGRSWKHVLPHLVFTDSVPKGSRHWSLKLDEDQVKEIKKRLKGRETFTSIGKDFRVSYATISDIAKGKTWRHI